MKSSTASATGLPTRGPFDAFMRRVIANVRSFFVCTRADLLPNIPLPPIRRFEVLKAFHGLAGQILMSAAVFPLLPDATKYAMGALKRSVHNCFFCYHGRRASLQEEVDFFQRRSGPSLTLARLLDLRREYRPSFAFVICCRQLCPHAPADGYGHLVPAGATR